MFWHLLFMNQANSFDKNRILIKVHIESLEQIEAFEALSKITEACACDHLVTAKKLINSFYISNLRYKAKIDES